MFDFIKNIFKSSERNVLISRQVISLEDNVFADGSVFYSAEGDCVRRVRGTEELMEEYAFLIELIRNRALSSDCFIDFELEVLPVIRRFISIVSIAPSEHALSNVFSTSLIRQALLGILRFSDIYDRSSLAVSTGSQNFFESLYLMLTLNLYRFYNRFRITTPGRNYEFKLFRHDSLEEFIRIHKATHLRFYLKKAFDPDISFDNCFMHLAAKCAQTHESLRRSPEYLKIRNLTTTLCFTKDELRFNSLEKKPEIDNLFLMENNLKKMLLKADEISAYLCAHQGGCIFDLGVYLRRFLSSGIISEKTEGAFVLEDGFVIEEGSPAHYLLSKAVERYYTDISFFSDFAENLKDFDLKNEFSDKNNEKISKIDMEDSRKNFYELILNSEYLFSNLYKKKARWISLLRQRKTYLVRGFEIYFGHNQESLSADPYTVVELRSMNDPAPLLKTLRCTTIRAYDPTYIEFKAMKGPLHFYFLKEPLDSLIELDKIRFSVIPEESALKVKKASYEEVEEFMLDNDAFSDEAETKADKAEAGASEEKRGSSKSASSVNRKTNSRSKKDNVKSEASVSAADIKVSAASSMADSTGSDLSTMSSEELCDLERSLIESFNSEHKFDTEAEHVKTSASAKTCRRTA